jgi:Sigma-54 interaction domain
MIAHGAPPRILIIDDLFGRSHANRRNAERANLCGQYLLEDITGDETARGTSQRILVRPVAQAVFHRGQTPHRADVGDVVENDLQGVLSVVRKGWRDRPPGTPPWAMILLDLCFYTGMVTAASARITSGMPEGRPGDDHPASYFGLQILEAIQTEFPDLPVVILSSKSRDEVSREFSAKGALGFLAREHVRSPELLKEYLLRHGLIPDDSGEIVGHSPSLLLALRTARRVALSRRNILIRGERGTGKELLARYIHRHRSDVPQRRELVTVDSGTLSPSLFASELFGHKRGAFTGADRDREGRIVQAHGGDLFLDPRLFTTVTALPRRGIWKGVTGLRVA